MTESKCFFAMFDIIGFANLLKEKGSAEIYKLYSKNIVPMMQHAAMPKSIFEKRNGINISIPDPKSQLVYYGFFSDTIVYFSKDNSSQSFFDILYTSLQFLKSGFGGLKNPYRGSIGYRDIIFDPNGILVGTSIIDSYKGEQSQMWAGCILTDKCEEFCQENGYIDLFYKAFDPAKRKGLGESRYIECKKYQKTLVKYSVPKQRKSCDKPIEYFEKEHFVIDWTHNVYKGAAEKSFKPSEIPHHEMIRQNTINFEKWARLNNR